MIDFNFFLTLAAGIGTILGDGITTMIGLGANKGFIESNPIARWMFSKLGQSLTIWLGGAAYLFTGLGIYTVNHAAGFVYAGVVAAAELYFFLHNYFLLKKLNIPLK